MSSPTGSAESKVPNTLAKCLTVDGCFFARGISDVVIRRLAESHRQDTGHEVSVEVLNA